MPNEKRKLRGLALTNAYIVLPQVRHFLNRMKEEFSLLGVELIEGSNFDIRAYLKNDGTIEAKELPFDFVLYLDKDRYISHMLEKAGYRLFNSADAIEACDDKMETYLQLAGHGIHMPKTISGPLCYAPEPHEFFLANLVKELGFPMVVKTNYGSMGAGVSLCKNLEELKDIESQVIYQPRIYQEFISSSHGHDYRLICVGGNFVAGYKRVSADGDFRSNLAHGGHGEVCVMTPAQIAMAEKAAQVLGLDYCGVDLLDSENGPVLCEVNSNAFIDGIEAITGKNVAKAYATHIISTLLED